MNFKNVYDKESFLIICFLLFFFLCLLCYSDEPNRIYRDVVLLTDDRNLRLKAHTYNVPVKDVPSFLKWCKVTWNVPLLKSFPCYPVYRSDEVPNASSWAVVQAKPMTKRGDRIKTRRESVPTNLSPIGCCISSMTRHWPLPMSASMRRQLKMPFKQFLHQRTAYWPFKLTIY